MIDGVDRVLELAPHCVQLLVPELVLYCPWVQAVHDPLAVDPPTMLPEYPGEHKQSLALLEFAPLSEFEGHVMQVSCVCALLALNLAVLQAVHAVAEFDEILNVPASQGVTLLPAPV